MEIFYKQEIKQFEIQTKFKARNHHLDRLLNKVTWVIQLRNLFTDFKFLSFFLIF